MKIFTNKDIRKLMVGIVAILVLMLILGQFFASVISHDYKKQMMVHDYEVAGNLLNNGIDSAKIPYAFTAVKTQNDISAGKALLEYSGYNVDTPNRFLASVEAFQIKYAVAFLIYSLVLSAMIMCAFYFYFIKQQKTIEAADASIHLFMDGDTASRIDSYEEGSLFKFFATINAMTTSLSAHVEAEKETKAFLKNTISDISHQLKTPLAALKMYNEIMTEEVSNVAVIEKFVGKTEQALERMEVLIQNLLKITRLDSGTIVLNRKTENIQQLMRKVLYGFETRAERQNKTIVLEGSDTAGLFCDSDWMLEAIGNIVKNALDHTNENAKIEIKWVESSVITKIMITDTGSGIAQEDIHYIFKRFYRSRYSQDKQGIGLGLALTKSIVELHNATITVESKIGSGSCFTIDFLKLTKL
jgi:signal transduction histidine kinase